MDIGDFDFCVLNKGEYFFGGGFFLFVGQGKIVVILLGIGNLVWQWGQVIGGGGYNDYGFVI